MVTVLLKKLIVVVNWVAEDDKASENLCKTFFLDTIVLELHSENLFIFATARVSN